MKILFSPTLCLCAMGKEFFKTCNVLPFSCTHLGLWRGKVKDQRYMLNRKDSRISYRQDPRYMQNKKDSRIFLRNGATFFCIQIYIVKFLGLQEIISELSILNKMKKFKCDASSGFNPVVLCPSSLL